MHAKTTCFVGDYCRFVKHSGLKHLYDLTVDLIFVRAKTTCFVGDYCRFVKLRLDFQFAHFAFNCLFKLLYIFIYLLMKVYICWKYIFLESYVSTTFHFYDGCMASNVSGTPDLR